MQESCLHDDDGSIEIVAAVAALLANTLSASRTLLLWGGKKAILFEG
jgi:hypothetical protein